MSTIKFKTNINCASCVRTVTPMLNKLEKLEKWDVDTQAEDKILTVEGDVSAEEVQKALSMVGFEANPQS